MPGVETSQNVGGGWRESAPDLEVGERSEREEVTQEKPKIPAGILAFSLLPHPNGL